MAESKKPSWSLYYSDNSPSLSLYAPPPPPHINVEVMAHSHTNTPRKNIELTVGKFLKFTHTIQEYLRFNVLPKIL